ncbi:hypothetical protein [Marinomonas sp. PE14-40]|uniref:hypothetical protein n=1 Tax=Marinomonas sp. PE14-40 TaxID=3060621 RepID=UPI003F6618C9
MPTALELKLEASKAKTYKGKKWHVDMSNNDIDKGLTVKEIKELLNLKAEMRSDVVNRKSEAIQRLNQTKYLTQGYPLINPASYSEAVKALQEKINAHDGSICKKFLTLFGPYTDIEADRKILQLLTDPSAIKNFVPKETRARMANPASLTYTDKRLIANSRFKLKSIFMQFEKMKVAQAELVSLSKDIAAQFDGRISCPPGAFQGLKSFSGSLDKITNRERSSDYGDLKDVARMTVEFDNEFDMNMARVRLEGSEEFKKLKSYKKSLKNRYGTSPSQDKHNSSALDSGYQDIKFFLQLSNGIIGELQLNTKGMLIAKEKEHLIYDLTRAGKLDEGTGSIVISTPAVLKHVVEKLDKSWFDFIKVRTFGIEAELGIMQAMMKKMSNSLTSFTINKKELEAMNIVSTRMYAIIGKGEKPPSSDAKKPSSASMYVKVSSYFFP